MRLGGGLTCRGGPSKMAIRSLEVESLGSGSGIETGRATVLRVSLTGGQGVGGGARRVTSGAGAVGAVRTGAEVSEVTQTSSLPAAGPDGVAGLLTPRVSLPSL